MFILYQAEWFKSGNLHHPIEGNRFVGVPTKILGWAWAGTLAQVEFPERIWMGVELGYGGLRKKYGKVCAGRFALGFGVASGRFPKRSLKVAEGFGPELVLEL